jgi:hypothetical protein
MAAPQTEQQPLAVGHFENAPEHRVEPLGIAASMTSLDRPIAGEVDGETAR